MVEVALRLVPDPVALFVVEDRAAVLLEHAAAAVVHDDHARPAEVAAEAPLDARAVVVRAFRVVDDDLGRVLAVLAHLVPRPVLGELGRREVAHVLVEPVGGEAGDEALLPPLLLLHLLDPGARDVPVVRHVVVVDDHRRRDRREEPADERVGPRLAVEVRVLLEVEHLFARLLGRVAARADELARLRRALVDVDLVAEEQQKVRPAAVRVADELLGEDVQGVDLAAFVVLVLRVRVGRLMRDGHAAGAE